MHFDAFLERCRAQWPEFDDPRRLARSTPSRRSLARARPRRNSRHGHREQAPAAQLRRRLSRPRAKFTSRWDATRARASSAPRAGNPHAQHLRLRQFLAVRRRRRRSAAAPSTRTPRPARSHFHDMDFARFPRAPRHGVPRASAPTSTTAATPSPISTTASAVSPCPHLADDALVIIDDTNKREARAADAPLRARWCPASSWCSICARPRNHHPTWWNGVQVFRFRRAASTPDSRCTIRGAPISACADCIYDTIALNFKHRRRAFNRRVKEMLRGRRPLRPHTRSRLLGLPAAPPPPPVPASPASPGSSSVRS